MKSKPGKEQLVKTAYQTLKAKQKDIRKTFLYQMEQYLKPDLQTNVQIFNVPAGSRLYRVGVDIYAVRVDGIQYKELQIQFDTDTDKWIVFKKVDDMTNRKFLLLDYSDIDELGSDN